MGLAAHSGYGVAPMNRRRLLQRILQGSLQNVSFSDFVNLLEGLGFREVRIRGSHCHFRHPSVPDIVTLQPVNGQAKPYQIRQIVRRIHSYNLRLEDEA